MIFSIGYQKIKVNELVETLKKMNINILVDVRSRPYGRKYEFNKKRLERELPRHGVRYLWAGDKLGGFGKIEKADIKRLAKWQRGKRAVLMCMEHIPSQCHRQNIIGKTLETMNVKLKHIVIENGNSSVYFFKNDVAHFVNT